MSTEPTPYPKTVAGESLNPDQEAWLGGYFSGLRNCGLTFADVEPEAGPTPKAGKKKLVAEENIKRDLNPEKFLSPVSSPIFQ